MRSHTPEDLAGHCPRCILPDAYCLCAAIPRVGTRTRFLVLRHSSEMRKTTNTGRLAALAITNSSLVDYGLAGEPLDASTLDLSDAWILFPDGEARVPATPPRTLVVLDGTWQQARRMLRRVPEFWTLPRLALPAPAPRFRLRRPPVGEGMSTLEAVAAAVRLLEGDAAAKPLEELLDEHCRRVLTLRGRANRLADFYGEDVAALSPFRGR